MQVQTIIVSNLQKLCRQIKLTETTMNDIQLYHLDQLFLCVLYTERINQYLKVQITDAFVSKSNMFATIKHAFFHLLSNVILRFTQYVCVCVCMKT